MSSKPKGTMKLISLFVPKAYLEKLEKLVEKKLYPNRAEAIRMAISDLLQYHETEKFSKEHAPNSW